MITKTPDDESMKACVNLAMNQNDDDNEEDMLVPLPKMETEESEELSTIWLPLKRKHIFNINSKTSTFILFRYFVMVTQCYKYQGINQSIFNRKLKLWIVENVLPYLEDDQLYPAFGAVLRILETIKEPDESGYQGTRNRKSKKYLGILGSFGENEKIFDVEADSEVEHWFRIGLAGCAALLALFLTIFLFVKLCKNRKKIETEEMTEMPRKRKSFKQKFSNFFRRETHANDSDDYYQYKKASAGARSVVFENEKKSRKGKKWSKDQVSLPLLGGASETEDEIFTKKSSSTSLKKGKFKISESSDDGSSVKKPSKSSIKSDVKKPPGFFRSKSPQKKSSGWDTYDER